MNAHQEQDLLSAYADGELTEREQVTLEAHLASCADCRGVLGALRATLADLTTLDEAVPSEQDSWALRSAIAKERRVDRRGRRWYAISGGIAAAVVAVLAFALSTGGGSSTGAKSVRELLGADTGAGGTGTTAGSTEVALLYSDVNYTAGAAQQRLLALSPRAREDQFAATDSSTAKSAAVSAPAAAQLRAGYSGDAADRQRLARCVASVSSSTSEPLVPRYYEAARFDGDDVFLLVLEATSAKRLELWVVRRSDCQTKYFAQTRA